MMFDAFSLYSARVVKPQYMFSSPQLEWLSSYVHADCLLCRSISVLLLSAALLLFCFWMSLDAVATLGAVVVRNNWESGDALFTAAIAGEEDAVLFIRSMCALRQSRRRPLQCDVLLQQYSDSFNEDAAVVRSQYRQLYSCLRRFYACYICLRGIAAPMLRTTERHQVSTLPRHARRVLSATVWCTTGV